MISVLMSVFDAKANLWGAPFCAPNEAVACRQLTDVMRNPEHTFSLHAQDFSLYRLGTFDDASCGFTLEPGPVMICRMYQLVKTVTEIV